jgi:hypothetical protein
MLCKLNATLPILVELVGNKPINEIFQTDINEFFDEVQKLPVRRDAKAFQGLPIRKVIEANTGPCIAEKTFISTYRACIGVFLQWAINNYKDRGFPALNTSGAIYRGERADGINKQRAMKPEELQKLFNNLKMKKYKANPETVHYFWLPLIGLYTGARINEVCQLNPFEDIKQDLVTGIHYFHFTDESESVESIAAKDTGYNVYGQENTISGDLSAGNRWLSESRFTSLYKYHLHEGDLVLTRKGSLGNSRLIKTLPQPGIIDSDTIRLRVSDTLIQSDFLSLLLHDAQYVSEQIMLSKRGAILGGINTETISNIVIVLPQRSEQDALMKELNTQVQQLDSGIHESGHVINLLKERRTALISAAVTGKIDVRGLISKAIPEEAAA